MIKAVTHHHPVFLKQAYAHSAIVDLVNHERYLSIGDRYIKFDPDKLRFNVMINLTDHQRKVRAFDNIVSAVHCARRVK